MDMFRKVMSAEISGTDTGGFKGYACSFLNVDRQNDIIMPGAFSKIMPKMLDEGVPILVDHENKTRAVIGTLVDASEDLRGLMIESQFLATSFAQETRSQMLSRAVTKMSASFMGKVAKYSEKQINTMWSNFGYMPNERQKELARGGAKVITEVTDVADFSVVAVPANPESRILAVKSFDGVETPLTVAPRIDLSALAQRANLADKFLSR